VSGRGISETTFSQLSLRVRMSAQEGITMNRHDHQTAPTQFVEANGVRFACRRFGNAASVPLVLNQHFGRQRGGVHHKSRKFRSLRRLSSARAGKSLIRARGGHTAAAQPNER
jgi:hypothetical protein